MREASKMMREAKIDTIVQVLYRYTVTWTEHCSTTFRFSRTDFKDMY